MNITPRKKTNVTDALEQTEQYLAEASLNVERLERNLRKAFIMLRTLRPCVEVYRDRWDFTEGTALLRDLDFHLTALEEITKE